MFPLCVLAIGQCFLTSNPGSNALSAEQVSKLHVTLAEIQKLFPRASAPMRIVLDFLEGLLWLTKLQTNKERLTTTYARGCIQH